MWSLPTWPATRSGKSWTPLGRGSPESAKSTPCCSRFSGTAVFPCEIAPSTYSAKLFNLLNLEAIGLCGEAALLSSGVYLDAVRDSLRLHAFSTAADDCDLWIEERTDE